MEKEVNKKGKKIFSIIFWPIVQILVVFAVATFLINYFSIDRFVKDNAKEKLEEAYSDVVAQLDNFATSGESVFELKPSEHLVNQSNNTQVYVFDKDFNDISIFDNNIYIDRELLGFLSSLLSDYELEEGTLANITFNNKKYIANTYVTSNSLNISEKYFVVIQELTDRSNLLRQSSRQMFLIQILILVLIIWTVYVVARDLSKPITKLSEESEAYVIGKGVTIGEEKFSTVELETLRESLINMQMKIDEESNKKNTIYENVAHDLRTPLVSILGYADGLKSGIIKDKNKACDVILRTGNQLKEMIENILVLSRFDNETYKGNNEEINLIDLINEQVETVKVIDDQIKIIFENNLGDDFIINTDRKLLVRIIQNLLSNAIKYAKTKVVIKAEYKNDKFDISVVDDGLGIDENNLKNIFTRYYKGSDGHFGIGLAVVKSSVDYLGGDVNVFSDGKNGTTFNVIL